MKKLFFITALIIYGTTFGQELNEKFIIKKGTFNIGGKAFVNLENHENEENLPEDRYKQFGITPNFGYAIKNNLMIGLGVGYSYSENKNHRINNSIAQRYKNINNRYSMFSYIKKYIPLGNKLAIYLQGEINYSENKNKNSSNSAASLNFDRRFWSQFFVGVRPGISYFLNKNVAFEANLGALGYSRLKSKYQDQRYYKSDAFNFNLDSSNLQFGVSYFF